jgi:hypothetical protein
VPGEEEQQKGRLGARLAQQWLNRTTRIDANLLNPDGVAKTKLQLKKADYIDAKSVFSFDLGGRFREGDFEGQNFLAECKKYKYDSKLSDHFRDFLAHCYRAVAIEHHMADQFFWISFAPHNGSTWDKITNVEAVKKAVTHNETRAVNFKSDEEPDQAYSPEIGKQVSDRIWLLILSDKQIDHLSLTQDQHAVLEDYIVRTAKEFKAS